MRVLKKVTLKRMCQTKDQNSVSTINTPNVKFNLWILMSVKITHMTAAMTLLVTILKAAIRARVKMDTTGMDGTAHHLF